MSEEMSDVIPPNVTRVRTSACLRKNDRANKKTAYGEYHNGVIHCDEQAFKDPSGFSVWLRNSLPGRRGLTNTSNGWADVEADVGGVWVRLTELRDKKRRERRPDNRLDVHDNELRLLSF